MGILSLVGIFLCAPAGLVLGIIGYRMGNVDLMAMDTGEMDQSGRSNTQAGKICSIIGMIGSALSLLLWVVYLLFAVVLVAAGAANP